jgi:hypothetical protein
MIFKSDVRNKMFFHKPHRSYWHESEAFVQKHQQNSGFTYLIAFQIGYRK